MAKSADLFAQLLTEAVHRIRLHESKTVQIVQDELGYALGRQGGATIEYWRKRNLPPSDTDIELLSRAIRKRINMELSWFQQFLDSAGYSNIAGLCKELFPEATEEAMVTRPQDTPDPILSMSSARLAPFTAGPPITHPRAFYGRTKEIKSIFRLLSRLPLQNVAVVGQRRTGKTSLLHYLRTIHAADRSDLRPDQRSDWLPDADQYRWVYVDFQDPRMSRRERLLTYLLNQMSLPVPEPLTFNRFMDVVSDQIEHPTIVLMDEIGGALASTELDLKFWWGLRSLGSNQTGGKLAFILASDQPPAQLAYEMDKTSPFFNIFGFSVELGPLSDSEARALVSSSPLPFSENEMEWVLEQSGRWPIMIQTLCQIRLAALESGQSVVGWQQEGLRQIDQYAYLLDAPGG